MTADQDHALDMFLLEVGEGRMPTEGSEEREAYKVYRSEEWAKERLTEIKNELGA